MVRYSPPPLFLTRRNTPPLSVRRAGPRAFPHAVRRQPKRVVRRRPGVAVSAPQHEHHGLAGPERLGARLVAAFNASQAGRGPIPDLGQRCWRDACQCSGPGPHGVDGHSNLATSGYRGARAVRSHIGGSRLRPEDSGWNGRAGRVPLRGLVVALGFRPRDRGPRHSHGGSGVSAPSLYQQVMETDFLLLPTPLQQFHALEGRHVLSGWVEVGAPASFVARVLARCLGAPLEAQRGPIRFELESSSESEHWVRHFPGRTMESRLRPMAGRIVESLGAARLTFALRGDSEKLEMQLIGLHFFGVPCPRWFLPTVVAEETASSGRLHFRVHASLPLVGVVAGYQGHLELPGGETE